MSDKLKVYIAGGIAGLNADEVLKKCEYMKNAIEALGEDIEVISPIRGKKIDAECGQRYEPNEIVTRDLWDVDRSDIIIAYPSERSIGTICEIFHASYEKHKPVIVIAEAGGHTANHYWTRFLAAKIVPTVDDAIDYFWDWYLHRSRRGTI